jgi:hypothetical protein
VRKNETESTLDSVSLTPNTKPKVQKKRKACECVFIPDGDREERRVYTGSDLILTFRSEASSSYFPS